MTDVRITWLKIKVISYNYAVVLVIYDHLIDKFDNILQCRSLVLQVSAKYRFKLI